MHPVHYTCIQNPGGDIGAATCSAQVEWQSCSSTLEPAHVCLSLEVEALADAPVCADAVALICQELGDAGTLQ